ncbi:S49 family peptidase [Halodurantibacterium flavum]|uniref:S49 family peptidase n=1 Tax=Halodurantibacterium flavum TaxID=1382802 RepID=A0ABW4S8D5_9RHOB
MSYPMIAQRVFGTPLLVDPSKGGAFLAGLGPRIVNGAIELRGLDGLPEDRLARAGRVGERASILADSVGTRARVRGQRLYQIRDGIAVIEATGTLVHRGEWIGESSGTTSYEGLTAQILAAAEDPVVRGIALEVDSYGGEVAGVFDLCDTIRAVRAQKPVWAFVAEAALSGGYALASQADRIILPRTGEAGSIGVLWVHADHSQALADRGIAITLIHAGAHKVDGNPFEAMPPDVRADMQARVGRTRDLFAATVAAGRAGRLTHAAALATEAQVYRGADAVAAGLADEVSDMRSAFTAFVAEASRPRAARSPAALAAAAEENTPMDTPTPDQQAAAPAAAEPTPTLAPTSAPEAASAVAAPAPAAPAAPVAPTAPAEGAAVPGQLPVAQVAALVEIGQQAARLGVTVDVADALRRGLSADALRQSVLTSLAARADGADIQAHNPPAAGGLRKESPLVAATKRMADAQTAAARH